jgi:hypothetical protein
MAAPIRMIVAFAIAPLLPVAVISAIWASYGRHLPNIGLLLSVATYAYGAELVLGVPAYLLTRTWQLRRPLQYALIAAVIALLPALPLCFLTAAFFTPICMVVGAAVAGYVFGAIILGKYNRPLERTRS